MKIEFTKMHGTGNDYVYVNCKMWIRDSPYAEAEVWFSGFPLTSKQMVELPEEFVMDRIIEAGKIAQELGAKVVGLGEMCIRDRARGAEAGL